MFNLFKKFFDYNEREINRLRKKVEEINSFEDRARKLKDTDFTKETVSLKEEIQSEQKTLAEVLPWSYALVREAARRVLGQRHFDVQLSAGIALHEGKIAEQKTGEGKTLSAISALYLNALEGKGAHLVTVNDYLARRDAGWMGGVFHKLGLTTAAIISDRSFIYDPQHQDADAQDWRLSHLRSISRKEAYVCDITYGINSEFGFDYLRDNMAVNPNDIVQRKFNFAIIDEADSILVDEARTPHIISAPYAEDTSKYYKYAQIVKQLDQKTDYVIDEKLRTANLSEEGIKKIESMLGVSNIYEKDFDSLFHIEAALKAQTLFKLDKDYIVKDGEVIIVDEFTGRLLYGRRFSEGLHQAIEAKEKVQIQRESKTLATISLQNYFRMYKKLAGMTGTAATEAEEFHKIYKTDVVVIPTHMPMVRQDHPDMIYKTERGKFNAVVEELAKSYKVGRPVLVGTTSIEKNEFLSRLLLQKGVPHELLNAKNHEREAMIIANAGKKGSITVATNMAGRGVDIVLGGETPNRYEVGGGKMEDRKKDYEKEMKNWQKRHDEVVGLGGLSVIGTERHESRRIDNQLRGRSGRQGDPGESLFYVALEDDLMRIFGGEQISRLMTFFKFPEDQPLTHAMVSKAIEQAQVKVEGFNFDIRKHLVDYDDVLNKQRDIIYTLRRKILTLPEKDEKEFKQTILDVFHEEVGVLINAHQGEDGNILGENLISLEKELNLILPFGNSEVKNLAKNKNTSPLIEYFAEKIEKEFKSREKTVGEKLWAEVVRVIFLSTIDKYWTEHLTAIEDLREGINLRGYAQLDPLVEYKNEAYSMFERLVNDINFEVTRRLFKVQVEKGPQLSIKQESSKDQPRVFKSASGVDPFTQAQKQQESSPPPQQVPTTPNKAVASNNLNQPVSDDQVGFRIIPPGQSQKKPGRNDPCWCGSGKKYKKCHYPN
ncbi:preprotein translocase subunit SecA [Candidatus Roizmanbacteria bacterium RIFCSPHIGHO2_02_FULL_37_15]|uniref:Protein translocase subunit SecA n=1 Tax=Candidatus Roizmanbacteria bacterium RIFCSPLOWO2_01_FULL_37_16 TaxID=1802058 RepID=A0A1F7ILP8_9BACT|nr:MAG: preprotein translocase subunit SecA [Candidatus Roizmanbacteria bacterium RIFCSPHIGHO2_01_FULL_37_16b]OGK20898.1 MAG: preprotein translocase subunit SecA [Candidatus Roizmanbacteria bacterium RIFCSPHIGHO2_02_FULL_37_15]OGK33778.1 MAG: preprotein translocase subunit SecA [Candidatus Roizmanbacteria bacterium RIFCSPHIGHO2_12_FULL_36_11]OGK44306.1 MAG: preprotein translocase subunit SecA [Candidatus Roizmanbacteria bacterium RIFCSPLOWO2_01_FULL_37_16]OGK57827.1 MAG: preprotein translocase 